MGESRATVHPSLLFSVLPTSGSTVLLPRPAPSLYVTIQDIRLYYVIQGKEKW